MAALKEKFQKEFGDEEWIVMAPHYKRGALILVDDNLDIIDIAIAVAEDNSTLIQDLITSGKLKKPTPEQVSVWEKQRTRFEFVIVQPFVLAREIGK
ncbi:MAG: DUF2288 domain-containing protein [Deltaproteobacteria bacterium]|nr:DUF2288 domain-containing protein [Deltaproteobacteria bacterium]